MTLLGYLKGHDMFGHKIGLNLKGSDSYQTPIGGLFSILINILILTYMILNLITMFTPGAGDFLSTVVENIIVDDVGKVHLNKTSLSQFVSLRKQKDNGAKLEMDD